MTKFETAPDGGAAETAPDGGAAETAQDGGAAETVEDAGATGTTDTDSGATGTADGGAATAAEDSDVAAGDTAGADGGDEMDDPLVRRVREQLEQMPDTDVTDLHLWRVGRAQYSCIVSIVTHRSYSADSYKAQLADFPELVHVTAEVNRCGENAQVDQRD